MFIIGRSSISDEKKDLIRKRLLQGHTVKDIALELGIAEKTVKKYKKDVTSAPSVGMSSEDTALQVDYTSILTKKEQALTAKIAAEVALYEDTIEGWTYHLTAHDDRIRQQGLWWSFIVYPDSAPDNWLERLKATQLQIALSPWHDKDVWNHDSPQMVNADTGEIIPVGARYKVGERKKMHRHGIVKLEKKCSWREINALLQNILHCPYIQKCRSLKNAYDYFLHINDPGKYQGYFKEDIIRLNGFVIEPTKFEQGIIFDEIIIVVIEHGFTRWTDVFKYYHGQPEYLLLLTSRPAVVTEVLKDNWRISNPDGRIQRVLVVEDEKNKKG